VSRYVTVKTQFNDGKALVSALMETGKWSIEQIEIHNNPRHLVGYKGKERPEVAHIIIRREHVGEASNDIGFVKNADGSYEAIISEFDSRKYGAKWVANLKGNYAYHKIRVAQESRGRRVVRNRCPRTGRQQIEITGYR
jgi:hypothetical protein